ncbi:MAG: tRNA pseudouridine(38-40) synthase TruA [Candidatus Omnitrophica bacterium]|nr:tRNA pseudouridine(38-40) synthase TruA [Candidatus Omnitrophota bacterium]
MPSTFKNIKLVVSYDGTDFFGFQLQPRHRTVQEVLEVAIKRILRETVRVHPAGRTDTGVHANAQVVHFLTRTRIPVNKLPQALNSALPEDVRVLNAQHMPKTFHARFSARFKQYEYAVYNSEIVPPLLRRTVYRFPFALDVRQMRKGAKILEGRHDFRSFQGKANGQENTVRRIRHLRVSKSGKFVCFTVEGDGFLTNMVRNLVGTLLLVGRKKLSLNDLSQILKSRDRRLAGPTVPALGLTLVKVIY